MTDLPPMDVAGRLDRARAALDEAGCDALLVTNLVNVRYLTAFTGSAATLLVQPDELLLVTDGRYGEQAPEQLGRAGVEARIEIIPNAAREREVVAEAARGVARLGLEADHVTWARKRAFASEWFPDAELVPTERVVDRLRLDKDAGEIARVAAAAAIADEALAGVSSLLGEEPTEAEFALELDTAIRRLGAEGNSFPTIVASGPNGAKPHHHPSDRRITGGDMVVLDFGALVDGYCSDMTRMVVVGEVTEVQQRMLDVVAEAQQAGVDAVRAGADCRDVDQACRQVIADAGWGDSFVHSTGHGVGLEIHEEPRVATTATDTLRAGWIVTVEPGVYLPEHGGVRIEDTLAVTADGCEILTRTPKEPLTV